PRGRAEPRGACVPRPLCRAHRDRVAALRRALRSLRGAQPGDPAERPEGALAAALATALRTDGLPALPRAGRFGWPAPGTHRDRVRQLAAARRLGRPMGALAVGRIKLALV